MSAAAPFKNLPSPRLVAENGGWSIVLPETPFAADAPTFDEAVEEMIMAIREYAADWHMRLERAPDHRNNQVLVQAIDLSDDAQLRDWLAGSGTHIRH
jgi:hypothetical protein